MREADAYRYSLEVADDEIDAQRQEIKQLEAEIERLRKTLTLVRDLLKGQKGAVAASLRAICNDGLGSVITPEESNDG